MEEEAAVSILVVVVLGILERLPGMALRGTVSPATGTQNTKERILRDMETISGTEAVSDTMEISFLEIPFFLITHTGMPIRTMALMTTTLATTPGSLLPCRTS